MLVWGSKSWNDSVAGWGIVARSFSTFELVTNEIGA